MSDFSLRAVQHATADAIARALPDTTIYANQSTQGTRLPAVFVRVKQGENQPQLGGMTLRVFEVELSYLLELGTQNTAEQYRAAADALEDELDLLTLADGMRVRTFSHNWEVAQEVMNYTFTVRARVRTKTKAPAIEHIAVQWEVRYDNRKANEN